MSLQNNPLLEVTLLSGVQLNDLFFIVINDGADPVSGVFNGLLNFGQGNPAFGILGGQAFFVSYYGDSTNPAGGFDVPGGNDIVLMAVPEPQTWATLLSGIGALVGLQRFRRRRG